jgi:GDPmannose 4,6-dehydratase
LITGARGQDGSYLTEMLAADGFEIVGIDKPARVATAGTDACPPGVQHRATDLLDAAAVRELVSELRPTRVFHLASASFVPASWNDPAATSRFTVESTINLLEAVRESDSEIRFLGAASAEIFGHPDQAPQNEATPVRPVTPYGAAKAHAYFLVGMYRERYGLHCGSAILYNHESPRRPPEFLPRKVARAAAAIKLERQSKVALGNLDAVRDWSFAGDVVEAMRRMPESDEAGDYVVASGIGHTVRDLVSAAFEHVGLDYREHVTFDPAFHRSEGSGAPLLGDATRARHHLGWEPAVDFRGLVQMLVDAELSEYEDDAGLSARDVASN